MGDDRYREIAESLYKRVERRVGAKPTQKEILDYVKTGKGYNPQSRKQRAFLEMTSSIGNVGGYVTKEGKEVKEYTRTRTNKEQLFKKVWRQAEEDYLVTHSLEESYIMLSGKYTKIAIRTKRSRLLGRKK